jgi:hypothetical protein
MEIEDLLGLLGLDFPRVLGVNLAAELMKSELEARGVWARIRRYGFLLPLAAAVALCWASGEDGLAALPCGLAYGAAAIAFHELHDRL